MWVYGLDWAEAGYRQVADACECGNEPSGSVKCGEFLDSLQTSQLLKKDSAPWSKKVIGRESGWPQMAQAGVQQRALILAMVDLEILLYLANTVTNQTNGAGQSHC